ncbi:MAG: hypothetical protein H6705_16870 [Myxococcales bacterium]|nr:hypothetical protein [Myxococcales bacterium]
MSRFAVTLGLALSLAGCDPPIDGMPHHPPPCDLPAIGTTCPIPLEGEPAFDAVERAAWCPAGAELESDARPGDVLELACAPPAGGWRIVVGVVAPGWGAAWLTPDGTLAMCSADGHVVQLAPLLADAAGRHWHAVSPDDAICLDGGACAVVSDPCGLAR